MLLLRRLRARRQAPMPFIVGAPRSGAQMLRLVLAAPPVLARGVRAGSRSPGGDVDAQAAFWRDQVAAAGDQGRACPHFLAVRFEHLVRDPETMLGRICHFARLQLRPEMLFYPQGAARRL